MTDLQAHPKVVGVLSPAISTRYGVLSYSLVLIISLCEMRSSKCWGRYFSTLQEAEGEGRVSLIG